MQSGASPPPSAFKAPAAQQAEADPELPTAYLAGIDGLRAVSVVAVLLFHAFPAVVPGGFIGVDVFFVISGFLITRLILADIEAGKFSLADFYLRRARRLLPSLLVVVVATTVASAIILLPDAFWSFGNSLAATMGFVSNFYFAETTDYFSGPAHAKPLLHTWSLAVEEQFYVVWPLLLMAWWRWGSSVPLSPVIAGLAGLSLAYSEWATRGDERFAFFMATSRAFELLIGAALAVGLRRRLPKAGALLQVFGLLGLATVLFGAVVLTPDNRFPGLSALPVCFGAAAVILACHGATAVAALLSLSPVRQVGRISYALYLWHWPLLALAHYHLERAPGVAEAVALLAMAVVLADLTWRFVEQPVRHGALGGLEGQGAVRRLRPYALAVGIAAAIGLSVAAAHGFPQRLDAAAARIWQQKTEINGFRADCDGTENILRNHDRCSLGVRPRETGQFDVLLIGDSNGEHWVPFVQLYAKERGLSARQATRNSCSALFGQDRPGASANNRRRCREFQHAIVTFIEGQRQLRRVIIGHAWHRFDGRSKDNGVGLAPGAPRVEGDLAYFLDKTIGWLQARGIEVVLMGPIPFHKDLPLRCVIADVRGGGDGSACSVARADLVADPAGVEHLLAAVAQRHRGVPLLNPTDVLCLAERCRVARDGLIFYHDAEHLGRAGAQALYRRLLSGSDGVRP